MANAGYTFTPNNVTPSADQQKAQVLAALKGPASWFATIAALSAINSIISMFGGGIRFIFGLGLSEFVDALAHQAGSAGYVLGLIINGIIAGVFVLFWHFARKGQKWAWYVGMFLYVIDGLIVLLFKDYLAVAFHAYALYRMASGLKILKFLDQLETQSATGAVSSTL